MLISSLLGPRFTPTPTPTPASATGGGATSNGGATSSGGTSQAAAPEPTRTTAPSAPPQSSEPVQPTTASPTAGTATSGTPNTASADAQPSRELPAARPTPAVFVSPDVDRPQRRAGADSLQLYTRQLSSGGFRLLPLTGKIAAEIRRIETVETAEITKSELIKQASVAMLAQANLRQQDVLDILNV